MIPTLLIPSADPDETAITSAAYLTAIAHILIEAKVVSEKRFSELVQKYLAEAHSTIMTQAIEHLRKMESALPNHQGVSPPPSGS